MRFPPTSFHPLINVLLFLLPLVATMVSGENFTPRDPNQIKVIGAGFGRTSTEAMTKALEILKLGPTFHMTECFKYPWFLTHWPAIELEPERRKANLERLIRGYRSTMDFPIALYYKELKEMYPKAKVVLTVRDSPEAWWKSAEETISRFCHPPITELTGIWLFQHIFPLGILANMGTRDNACAKIFPQSLHSKAHAMKAYVDHIEEVKRVIPAEDLLVFNAKDGWKPLCEFLGVPIPDVPFPHTNTKAEMQMGPIVMTTVLGYASVIVYALVARHIWKKLCGDAGEGANKAKRQ